MLGVGTSKNRSLGYIFIDIYVHVINRQKKPFEFQVTNFIIVKKILMYLLLTFIDFAHF